MGPPPKGAELPLGLQLLEERHVDVSLDGSIGRWPDKQKALRLVLKAEVRRHAASAREFLADAPPTSSLGAMPT